MKKIILLLITGFALSVQYAEAQQKKSSGNNKPTPVHRCATMKVIAKKLAADPSLAAKWKKEGEKKYLQYLQKKANTANRELGTQDATIIIPIVFHLVGDAALLNSIPDRDVYEQIEILNRDYAGKKADGYKGLFAPEIAALAGKMDIKFVLARRTPAGALTSGIQRRVTSKTFDEDTYVDVKHTATGGFDAWDTEKYLNIWCCVFADGTLGISAFPYSDTPDEQGVTINLDMLGSNPCRAYAPAYAEGATLTHEVGHFFYLYHAFGDQSNCNNADFEEEPGWELPATVVDDTPPEKGDDNTMFGNVAGNYSDGCSPLSYGMMYQSFMNYYDDRALYLFSEGQKQRVLATINIFRDGYLATNGATPPVDVTDAYLVSMTPMGKCDSRAPVAVNTPLTASIRNLGTTPLTAVDINYKLDGNAVVTTTYPLSLAPGQDTLLSLAPIVAAAGNHTVLLYTSAPNGIADNFLHNDTLKSLINVRTITLTAPFTESFGGSFPPSGWAINNDNADTWIKSATAGYTATGAATVQNYDYEGPGEIDELITPAIDLGTFDSSTLSFQVAYGVYEDVTSSWDGLEVYVSGDGGQHFNLVYKKTGTELATIPDFTGTVSFDPETDKTKWRKETISLNDYIVPGSRMIIKFRNVNAYGNNTYIDDIKLTAGNLSSRDAFPVTVKNVPVYICADPVLTPSVVVGTNGKDILTSLKVNYQVDNGPVVTKNWTGSLNKGQTTEVSFDAITNIPTGQHQLTVFTSEPNGLDDNRTSNDTTKLPFAVLTSVNGNVAEGFEGTDFAPANWVLVNADNSHTWERTTTASRTGVGAMVIKNFTATAANTTDKFISPKITLGNADSAIVSFDYSYAPGINYPGSTVLPLDTLEVLLTKDCGLTSVSLWKKWGMELQTVNSPNTGSAVEHIPTTSSWRHVLIPVTDYVKDNSNFQVFFVANGNKQNNLYIDNINIYAKELPARLRNQGYLVYPNPITNSFSIQHWAVPTNLKAVQVFNAAGQLVWDKRFAGNASNVITVDLTKQAKGVYTLKMIYEAKTIVEKIIKN